MAKGTVRNVGAAWIAMLLLVSAAPAALAQVPDTGCTYRACALRVEPRGLSTALVRGAEGEVVARLGPLGPRPQLVEVMSRSDSAVVHAHRYQRLAPLAFGAAVGSSLVFVVPTLTDELDERRLLISGAGGVLVSIYAAVRRAGQQGAVPSGVVVQRIARPVSAHRQPLPRIQMRGPRYRFPEEVRSTTRVMGARMVEEGTVAQTPEELHAWIVGDPAVREPLERGGYGRAFDAGDLLPLLHVFVVQAGGQVPGAEAEASPPPTRSWMVPVLIAVVVAAIAVAVVLLR